MQQHIIINIHERKSILTKYSVYIYAYVAYLIRICSDIHT